MPAKFEIYKDKGNQFRFRLKAANGEVIAVGESYPDKKSAQKGIASIQKSAPAAVVIDTTAVKAEEKKPAKKPAAKKPRTSGPVAKKPAAKKPRTSGPAAKKPAAKNPRTSGPAVKKAAAKKPAAKTPVVNTPVAPAPVIVPETKPAE